MKRLPQILSVVLFVAILAMWWQWRVMGELQARENGLREEREQLRAALATVEPVVAPGAGGLTEAELPHIQQLLASAGKAMLQINGGRDEVKAYWSRSIGLMEGLERATPDQIEAMFNDWARSAVGDSANRMSASRLMSAIAELNPQGALQLFTRGDDLGMLRDLVPQAFESWFRTDSRAMRDWIVDWRRAHPADLSTPPAVLPGKRAAGQSGFSKDAFLQGQAAIWESAANVLRDPTGLGAEGIVKGIRADGSSSQNQPALRALAAQLDTTEKRVQFLRALHTASGGQFDVLSFMIPLAQQTPFAQVAQMADLAPNFEAPEENPYVQKASVREMAANFSRDATPAERWQWLTKDPRPAMELIEGFVIGCARNDPVTAKHWIESLPEGELRRKAEQRLKSWDPNGGPA